MAQRLLCEGGLAIMIEKKAFIRVLMIKIMFVMSVVVSVLALAGRLTV